MAPVAQGIPAPLHRSRCFDPLDRLRTVASHQYRTPGKGSDLGKKNASPSVAIIDSQSVKCADTVAASDSGYDAGKKINGRKRHILTDTCGNLLGVVVTPASVQDRDGAKVLLCLFAHLYLTLKTIFADGGYAGQCEDWVKQMGLLFGHTGLALRIVKRSDVADAPAKGFVLLPMRWIVERTFGWLVKSRRLVRDYERKPRHHEALVYLSMISLSTRSLAKIEPPSAL